MLHHTIRFRLNGAEVTLPPETPPTMTLLHWLRGPAGLTGTKEGCAEGDCGACTIVQEGADGHRTPLNACLMMLGQAHGTTLRTVEGLRGEGGQAHPIQRAMADAHATQCGFCTPGFVMAAWAHAREGGDPHEALAGNLCRCTGYRPILEALASSQDDDEPAPSPPAAASACFAGSFHRPTTLAELLDLRAAHPSAWLLAGGTDLGLQIAEGTHRPADVICLLAVPELQTIDRTGEGLSIGAAVSYARLLEAVEHDASLGLLPLRSMLARLGSRQIRGLGTVGGNLGTASPIGDMLPPLLALDAAVRLRSARGARDLPVKAFLLGYRQSDLRPDEIIERIFLPTVPPGALFVCEKLSKRWDQDISTVSAAFLIERDGDHVRAARLAFGGMGPTAARAPSAEAALVGAPWSPASLERAAAALAADFTPLTDWRGTDGYRRAAAAGLLRRLWWRAEGHADLAALDFA